GLRSSSTAVLGSLADSLSNRGTAARLSASLVLGGSTQCRPLARKLAHPNDRMRPRPGERPAHRLAAQLEEYKLESVTFTNERKRELFSRAKKAFQANGVRIPRDARIRDDLASMQRVVTPQGVVRYVAARTRDGHADRATALALAIHAANAVPAEQIAPSRIHLGLRPHLHRPLRTRFRSAWCS
ncbi:MAG: hypothetical protein ACREIA_06485, partial [Opitutaceae bacterium]